MTAYLYNPTVDSVTVCGQLILTLEYYELLPTEQSKFANSSEVISAITNETIIVSKSNAPSDHITDYAEAINYLKGDILDIDAQGRQVLRVAAGQAGWTYLAHPIEFETAKIGSLYEKLVDGTDRGTSSIKFYDVNDVEITDPLDEANIIKTVVLFKPPYDYELLSGDLQQIEAPNFDCRIWVIGGILELGGAYTKEFAGGINMRFYGSNESIKTDGRAAKYMKKDITGVPYQGNQLQIVIKHVAGMKHKLKLVLEYFKA